MRRVDLELLAGAAVAAALLVAVVAARTRRLGALAVVAGLGLALVGDRMLVHALPRDALGTLGPWPVAIPVALLAALGGARLPTAVTGRVAAVLPLALASLAGVWAGVPETSAALLGAGALVGVAAVVAIARPTVTRGAAAVVALVPVGAAVEGAVGERHALVGGLLCSATVVLLALRPPAGPVPGRTLAAATAIALVAAGVAARQVAIRREWAPSLPWALASLLLAGVAGSVLARRPAQRS